MPVIPQGTLSTLIYASTDFAEILISAPENILHISFSPKEHPSPIIEIIVGE